MVCIAMVMVCITRFSDYGCALLVMVLVFQGAVWPSVMLIVCTEVEYG